MTIVYRFNDPTLRADLWRDIKNIANQMIGAWVIIGDFNSILNQENRVGGKVNYSEINTSRNMLITID